MPSSAKACLIFLRLKNGQILIHCRCTDLCIGFDDRFTSYKRVEESPITKVIGDPNVHGSHSYGYKICQISYLRC